MDWIGFGVQALAATICLHIGRWMGRREERYKAPAPAPVVPPVAPPPEVQTYTVEVGRLEAFHVRAKLPNEAVTDAVERAAAANGGGPGRFMALCRDVPYLIVRAPVIDNGATTEGSK